MRFITLTLICFMQAVNIFSQGKEFVIDGKLPSSVHDGEKVYLQKINYKGQNNLESLDSTLIKDSKFRFQGIADDVLRLRYLTIGKTMDKNTVTALIALEPGRISLTMDELPALGGTKNNIELNAFTNRQIKLDEQLANTLQEAQTLHATGTLTESKTSELEYRFEQQKREMHHSVYDFVYSNIKNEIGEFFFTLYTANFSPSELEILYTASNKDFKENNTIKSLMQKNAWGLGSLREGQSFEGLELTNLKGEKIDISTHFADGKVVLVDFWASWCAPCRKSMPILAKLYERYRDFGFEIVGISLDDDSEKWKSAIKIMDMQWPQYIDSGQGWQGAAAQKYEIQRIPQTYLIDKHGKIAGHDLIGGELITKIEELLKQD